MTQRQASDILRAVEKGESIKRLTIHKLLRRLRKTGYRFYVEVTLIPPTGNAILKTIDHERDAKETIRKLKEKKHEPA